MRKEDTVENEQWLMRVPQGTVYGPVDARPLQRWCVEGRITADCEVASLRSRFWKHPNELPELAAANHTFDATSNPGNPFAARVVKPTGPLRPHRGRKILMIGIAGCLVPFLSIWPAMEGTKDLRRMRDGILDPSGEANTRSGQMLGMVSSIIWIFASASLLMFLLIQRICMR